MLPNLADVLQDPTRSSSLQCRSLRRNSSFVFISDFGRSRDLEQTTKTSGKRSPTVGVYKQFFFPRQHHHDLPQNTYFPTAQSRKHKDIYIHPSLSDHHYNCKIKVFILYYTFTRCPTRRSNLTLQKACKMIHNASLRNLLVVVILGFVLMNVAAASFDPSVSLKHYLLSRWVL